MFGFIKRKIREFTESFSEHAEEEPADVTDVPQDREDSAEYSSEEDVSTEPSTVTDASRDDASTDVDRVPEASAETTRAEPSTPDADDIDGEPRRVEEPEADQAQTRSSPLEEHTPTDRSEPERDTQVSEPASRRADTHTHERPAKGTAAASVRTDETSEIRESVDAHVADASEEREPRGFGKLMGALTKRSLSDDAFEKLFTDLEIGLLEANTAYEAVQAVKENLRERLTGQRVSRFSASQDVSRALAQSIAELFEEPEDLIALADEHAPLVIMLIGINGSGKTTTAAKLARAYQKAGKRPVLAAADTFRAAAIQQLEAHAHALDCRIIKHDYGADPAAVAYDAITHAKSGKADVVIIDTAGRLHSNENLLKELTKLKRVAQPHRVVFVGESIAGNDLIEQAETFNAKIGIDSIILTKTDVDESGGGMLSVSHITRKPIDYLGGGQGYDDLTPFSADVMARLLGLERDA